MRGTVAKRLRREARENTVGLPERDYGVENVRDKVNRAGKFFNTVTLKLNACTRAEYQSLKRQYKRGRS